jgi:hypothetical protein
MSTYTTDIQRDSQDFEVFFLMPNMIVGFAKKDKENMIGGSITLCIWLVYIRRSWCFLFMSCIILFSVHITPCVIIHTRTAHLFIKRFHGQDSWVDVFSLMNAWKFQELDFWCKLKARRIVCSEWSCNLAKLKYWNLSRDHCKTQQHSKDELSVKLKRANAQI